MVMFCSNIQNLPLTQSLKISKELIAVFHCDTSTNK